ncbi:protein C12orf4-like isoform X3 [Diaphorina citri]|uniref:Protein C12orf4-like isoform X3 n=1 Tax=Diaphorina citri TaxID=121845 RepID=A0A3Q0IUD7_DIACI|nr:protein C12orf4-like isoform X3 [Diaphorina citri]
MTVVAEFKYKNGAVTASIELPISESISELSHHIIEEENLQPYEEDDLLNALEDFIQFKKENLNDKLSNEALNLTLCINNDEDIIRYWEKQFKEETVSYGDKSGSSDSELFSTAYHKLVHSGIALDTMLQVEQSYAHDVVNMIQQRDDQIEKLTKQQEESLNKKLETHQGSLSSEEINNLDQMYIEQQSFTLVKWISKIDTLKETQRREYRDWVMKLLEEHQRTITLQSSL